MGRNIDLAAILLDLHRMRLELERSLDSSEETLLMRKGSIRGRKLHVFNTIRMMQIKSQWQRDYIKEEANKVVVYITTCGILRRVWERCRDTVELLKALKIKAEFRDLNIDPSYADELADRLRLNKSDRELVYDGLPMVYVNGKYFGVQELESAEKPPTSFQKNLQWLPRFNLPSRSLSSHFSCSFSFIESSPPMDG
ncbi:Glutaredoxin domain-containing protein, partial [Trichostrongylus colubriformis]